MGVELRRQHAERTGIVVDIHRAERGESAGVGRRGRAVELDFRALDALAGVIADVEPHHAFLQFARQHRAERRGGAVLTYEGPVAVRAYRHERLPV